MTNKTIEEIIKDCFFFADMHLANGQMRGISYQSYDRLYKALLKQAAQTALPSREEFSLQWSNLVAKTWNTGDSPLMLLYDWLRDNMGSSSGRVLDSKSEKEGSTPSLPANSKERHEMPTKEEYNAFVDGMFRVRAEGPNYKEIWYWLTEGRK